MTTKKLYPYTFIKEKTGELKAQRHQHKIAIMSIDDELSQLDAELEQWYVNMLNDAITTALEGIKYDRHPLVAVTPAEVHSYIMKNHDFDYIFSDGFDLLDFARRQIGILEFRKTDKLGIYFVAAGYWAYSKIFWDALWDRIYILKDGSHENMTRHGEMRPEFKRADGEWYFKQYKIWEWAIKNIALDLAYDMPVFEWVNRFLQDGWTIETDEDSVIFTYDENNELVFDSCPKLAAYVNQMMNPEQFVEVFNRE